ncbi:hypothetical protein GOODEAATRI_033209, partial [Goodea atripinnis]
DATCDGGHGTQAPGDKEPAYPEVGIGSPTATQEACGNAAGTPAAAPGAIVGVTNAPRPPRQSRDPSQVPHRRPAAKPQWCQQWGKSVLDTRTNKNVVWVWALDWRRCIPAPHPKRDLEWRCALVLWRPVAGLRRHSR